MNLILFGPPGVGKGTQAQNLIKNYNMRQISTGHLLRNAIKNRTELGLRVEKTLADGQLVSDEIVGTLVKDEIQNRPNLWILDGYPRTISQAETLEGLLRQVPSKTDLVISISANDAELVRRLSGRRTCSKCGAVFHIEDQPSQKEGICDKCGGALIIRPDDQKDVITRRLQVYRDNTAPLEKYYEAKGALQRVDGSGNPEQVFGRIQELLQKKGLK